MSESYRGEMSFDDISSEENIMNAMIRQFLSLKGFTSVVRVESVRSDGGLSPVGFVSVRPMVHLLDGDGTAVPHNVLHNLPFFRLQGGGNAIIIDPQPGDIGIALFADRDITVVKKNREPGPPGSLRRNSLSDGLYIGGFLNGTPTQVIQFSAGGITIISPEVNINGLKILSDGTLVLKDGLVVDTHKHGGVSPGSNTTDRPSS